MVTLQWHRHEALRTRAAVETAVDVLLLQCAPVLAGAVTVAECRAAAAALIAFSVGLRVAIELEDVTTAAVTGEEPNEEYSETGR